jgi:hypothetical protein
MNLKKPLLSTTSSAPMEELEKKLLGGPEAPAGHEHSAPPTKSARQPVPPPAKRPAARGEGAVSPPVSLSPKTRLVPKTAKPKIVTTLLAVRVPLELHERLKTVAHYNRLNMTDIVIEAIGLHLQNFPQPK